MSFSPEDIRKNRDFFTDVQRWVNKDPGYPDFVLVDTRARDAFAKAHIPGAVNLPEADTG